MRNIILIASFFFSILLSCKGPEARRPIQSKTGTFIAESAERNKIIFDKEKSQIEEIIKADSLTDYINSSSGFWYYYNKKDTLNSKMPEFGDIVTFTYDIKDLKNNTIVSAEENGLQYYKVEQSNQELTSGIRDAIKLMKEGETVTILLPSYKAYGYYGIENKLGTNIPIKTTITLQSLKDDEEKD